MSQQIAKMGSQCLRQILKNGRNMNEMAVSTFVISSLANMCDRIEHKIAFLGGLPEIAST